MTVKEMVTWREQIAYGCLKEVTGTFYVDDWNAEHPLWNKDLTQERRVKEANAELCGLWNDFKDNADMRQWALYLGKSIKPHFNAGFINYEQAKQLFGDCEHIKMLWYQDCDYKYEPDPNLDPWPEL